MFTKFSREDGYVRYDTKWYGFGYSPYIFSSCETNGRGWQVWINSYRRAPIKLRTFTVFGVLRDAPALAWKFSTSGSRVDPLLHWSFRLGRVFVGGTTPTWLRKSLRRRYDARMDRWAKDYEECMKKWANE